MHTFEAEVEVLRSTAAETYRPNPLLLHYACAGWSSLIGRCMGDGEAVDEGRRQQLRQEAQVAGDAVHR
jgi:hypothetical protein